MAQPSQPIQPGPCFHAPVTGARSNLSYNRAQAKGTRRVLIYALYYAV